MTKFLAFLGGLTVMIGRPFDGAVLLVAAVALEVTGALIERQYPRRRGRGRGHDVD
jgi:hypothetical protein